MHISVLVLAIIVFGAAFAQGFSGFGYGILAMAVLSLVVTDIERASVFVTLSVTVLIIALLIRSRRDVAIDYRQAAMLFLGLLAGCPLGYWFVLRQGDMPACRIIFGAVLILFALNGLLKPHIRRHIPMALAPVFGVFSGLLSGAFSSGGPPIVLYLYAQEDDPRKALGTVQLVFLGASVYRLAIVGFSERGLTQDLLLSAAVMAPVAVVGTLAGYLATRKVSSRAFLLGVYALIVTAGALNILKGLTPMR
ncbi:MAG: hypothetical protein A3K19_02240 [Lentisphaerae bacterium RIFOXYB12_FULL_65_16]|nr:MAG: hypothetical protein A3K18_14020 [Lentisphaerae bacterium RIFOXYA12_64_32]OGV86696.1 MAG: hypothetical protein A3K19_02240 [Lentisphaerae bacterium RIFOXYB12_FULL_65_16]